MIPETMRAYVGTPDGPELRELPVPVPGPGEVLVEISAFSVNRGELGLFARRPEGWRPGQDVAGTVVQTAEGAPAEGSAVAAMVDFCGWAEYTAIPLDRLAPVPDAVAPAKAATLGVAGLTALRALRRGGPLLGRRVLITGASGGVGSFAVQLADASGAEVTALTGTHRSLDLRALGARHVITSLDQAEGEFDLLLESVGGEVLSVALKRVAPHGHIVLLGTSTAQPAPLSISSFVSHARQTLHPFWVFGSGEPVGEDLGILLRLTARGLLDPVVGLEADWTELPKVMKELRERRVAGKAVLLVGGA
jgi:NADPH:quinone reductase